MFGDGSQDMDGQAVGRRHVAGDEIYAGLHQPRDEVDVPSQPVELGDDQRSTMNPAQGQRLGQPGAVVPAAALDLLRLSHQDTGRSGQELIDGHTLGLQPQAGCTLFLGADPVIGDVLDHRAALRGPLCQ